MDPNSTTISLILRMGWSRLRCNISWTTYWWGEKFALRWLWIFWSQEICDGDGDQCVTNRTCSRCESRVLQGTYGWLSVWRMQKRTYCMRKQFWPITSVKPAIMLGLNSWSKIEKTHTEFTHTDGQKKKRKYQTWTQSSIHTNRSQTLHYSAWQWLSRESKRTYLKRRGKYLEPSAHGHWDMYCNILTIAPVTTLFFLLTWDMSATGVLQRVLLLTYPYPVHIEALGKGVGLSIPVTSSDNEELPLHE